MLRKNRKPARTSTAEGTVAANDIEARAVESGAAPVEDVVEPATSPDQSNADEEQDDGLEKPQEQDRAPAIKWATDLKSAETEKALRVPGPKERDNGAALEEVDEITSDDDDLDKRSVGHAGSSGGLRRRRTSRSSTAAISIERIASSMFVLGDNQEEARSKSREPTGTHGQQPTEMSSTSNDRSSDLRNLSKEELGGIEYRSLWLLLKIIVGTEISYGERRKPLLTDLSLLHWSPSLRRDRHRSMDLSSRS